MRFLFVLLYLGLGFRLYEVQINQSVYYGAKAEARDKIAEALSLRRGDIFFMDRDGSFISVAQNKEYPVVVAIPRDVVDPHLAAGLLSPILQKNEEELLAALSNSQLLYRLLAEKISEAQVLAVNSLALKGIYVDTKQYRYYPFGELAAQLIGFVGFTEDKNEPKGLYGIEKFYDSELARGESVNLTIDKNIQSQAEKILKELAEKYGATGGTVIVEEPTTGKILALANTPGFDPNRYEEFPLSYFINPAVQHMYEPGSVFKPITMASGIDSGKITPETTFVDNGFVTLNGKTIRNHDNTVYGKVTMTNVIERSINTGSVYAEQKIGHATFIDYLKSFGFWDKTEVDLPGEQVSNLKNLERKEVRAIDFATASFGQGVAVTPLALINAYAIIANRGLMMRPYVNAATEPAIVKGVITEKTSEAVMEMMRRAVVVNRLAAIPNFNVAGKTGTANIPDFQVGGYTDELIHTYVGLAPVSAPRFVILMKLDKPQVGELAGLTVVPGFRRLAEFVLNYYNIYPDNLATSTVSRLP